MTARRLTVTTLATLCALVGLLALWGAAAQAIVSHEYLSRISEVPAEGPSHEPVAVHGKLSRPTPMTFDSGHVWVVEGGSVDEFDGSTGAFLAQPLHSGQYQGVAVGHLAGEPEPQLYATEYLGELYEQKGQVGVYSVSGATLGAWTGAATPAKSLGIPFGVAVDNSKSPTDWAAGDVYVAASGQRVVDVFKAEAGGGEKYVTQLTGTCATPVSCTEDKFNSPYSLAVDSANGDLLVEDQKVVDVFEPTVLGEYVFVRQLTGTPAGPFQDINGIAVDSGSGEIYVSDARASNPGVPAYSVVDQFTPEGVYRGHLTGTPEGPFTGIPPFNEFAAALSVGVDPASHHVYVSAEEIRDENSGQLNEVREVRAFVDFFGPTIVVPGVSTGSASEVRLRSATLNGTVNPEKTGAATCQFVYGTTTRFGSVAPCSEGVAEGESPVPVSAQLSGLPPDTTYFYRLQASNAEGKNFGESTQDQQFTTSGPKIDDEGFASAVTSGSVTLNATVDPRGGPTSYYFQYGTSVSYGTSVPLAPGASLGSGEGALSASVHLQGLAPGTTYHYRVIVVGESNGEPIALEGADRSFTTQASGNQFVLPDGRAWEMVTPSNKQGAGLRPLGPFPVDIQASVNGSAIAYSATAPFAVDPAGSHSPEDTPVFSTRNAPGSWASQDISTPHNEGANGPDLITPSEYRLFSSDLSLGLVEPTGHTPLPPLPPGSETTAYLRNNATGEYEALVTAAELPGAEFGDQGEGVEGGFKIFAATPDLSDIALVPTAFLHNPPTDAGLYVWSKGRLLVASVMPHGEIVSSATFEQFSHDGSSVVISLEGHLYMRDLARGETVSIEAPQGTPGAGAQSLENVFFSSATPLTVGASADNLYAFEVTSGPAEPLAGRLTDVTPPQSPGEDPDVIGVTGSSKDGSYVYFGAGGVLGDGAERAAVHGADNVYVEHYDTGSKTWGKPIFVTTMDKRRFANREETRKEEFRYSSELMRVSSDGGYLVFASNSSLTGYDNRTASGAPVEEVFEYDAVTDRLVCASCNATGVRPAGSSTIWGPEQVIYGSDPNTALGRAGYYQPRQLSNDGRIFFNSGDALVPADVNGHVDVYEYEPAGVGSCQGPGHGQSASIVFDEKMNGCVGLISSGTSSDDSLFMDASETGGDVFFMTLSRLAPQDVDTSMDVYDAHECSASAPCAATPPAPVPPCATGDGCKAAPSPQPTIFGSPASATFSGAGNLTPAVVPKSTSKSRKVVKCRRGTVKRNGRCVKKKAKRASRPTTGRGK